MIENHVAGRDTSHQSIVGAQLVIAALYYTLGECEGTALFLRWGLPARHGVLQATANSLRSSSLRLPAAGEPQR